MGKRSSFIDVFISKLWRWTSAIVFTFSAIVCLIIFCFFHYGQNLPPYRHLKTYQPHALTQLYDKDGALFHEYGQERRIFTPLTKVPEIVVKAFIAAEDKMFFDHMGLDALGIIRAFINNQQGSGRQQGASTITQQVAKNFFTGNEPTLERKAKEAIMALRLEWALSKNRILELYLNEIYLGHRSYGIAAAARTYFSKALHELSIAEVALLAALPKAPTQLDPHKSTVKILKRRNWVLRRMLDEGHITKRQYKVAKQTPIKLTDREVSFFNAPYFTQEIRSLLRKSVGKTKCAMGGFKVETTLKPDLQKAAKRALRYGLRAYDRRHGWRGSVAHLKDVTDWQQKLTTIKKPKGAGRKQLAVVLKIHRKAVLIGLGKNKKGLIPLSELKWAREPLPGGKVGGNIRHPQQALKIGDVVLVTPLRLANSEQRYYKLEQVPKVSGGIVIMDPHSGHVLAIQGGYSHRLSQYNCSTQAKRQPGSAFKPFVYLAALEQGMTPSTPVHDIPSEFHTQKGLAPYMPHNYTNKYMGEIPLRTALVKSSNVATVGIAHQIGMPCILDTCRRFGLYKKLPNHLSVSLGAKETTLLKLTTAYAMIANGGKVLKPHLITRVWDRENRVVYNKKNGEVSYLADPEHVLTLSDMLHDVVLHGTGRRLKDFPIAIAGKTGSTNNFKDAWFVGYTSNLVIGVFVGHLTPKSLGPHESGARVAIPIFEAVLREVYG